MNGEQSSRLVNVREPDAKASGSACSRDGNSCVRSKIGLGERIGECADGTSRCRVAAVVVPSFLLRFSAEGRAR